MRDTKSVVNTVAVSIGLAFVLSVLFWLVYGVFNLAGFILWSLVSGVVGGLLGELAMKRLVGGLLFTAIIRIAVFIALSGLFF